MMVAPVPVDEERRLSLLASCKIMYTPAEQAFDDVAQLAADLCGTEIALITLVDADYQWFKAKVGVEQTGTPRDLSFCGHCIVGRQPFIVEDTHLDPRFADNPLVTGDPHLRFYAGVPLLVDGLAIGALSVAGRTPRTLPQRQVESLERLANRVSRELQLRRDLERARGPAERPSSLSIGAGASIGGHRITRELGRGSVGAVFEAFDDTGVRVAIKTLLPAWARHDALLERFAREARVLMQLTTRHVAQLFDVGNLPIDRGGLPYLVLEFLEGYDLGQVIDEQQRVPWQQAFAWCADACEGVAAAHELGVVHRDLKPSNIFLAAVGDATPVVKVIDFGIAREAAALRITAHDDVIGSPAYMSPEQMTGQDVDGRSDVWSIGACLYELISGRIPFPGSTPFEMFANALARPPLPLRTYVEDIPADVQAIVMRCLRKPRDERFASMHELATALRQAGTAVTST